MSTLEKIKGIGPKTIQILERLNIHTEEDLIEYYPYRFDVLERSNLRDAFDGDKVILDGIVQTVPLIYYFHKKMNKMTFSLNCGEAILNVTIFNRAFLKNNLKIGTQITVIGKYDKRHGNVVASEIRFGMLPKEAKIEPVYHVTNGISSAQLHKMILMALESNWQPKEIIPAYLVGKYKLDDKRSSILEIHSPGNKKSLERAINYLKYEELFLFMLKMNQLKKNRVWEKGISREITKEAVDEFISQLPFTLTADQLKCVNQVLEDMNSSRVMKRLIQGDVGSGKTIVAIISLYINYLSGYQGAFMAPTEILAEQHYQNVQKMFANYPIKIALLTGKMKKKERGEVLKQLASKEIDIVIGTHSLFSEDVYYDSLGLVITDEQHRFGVNQRTKLKEKGISTDVLYLSATPIPRTYAITLYGDMDVSNIHLKPKGRREIITEIYANTEIKTVLAKIHQEIRQNHQVYVIATQIEESEDDELENVKELKDKFERALGKIAKIGMLHGKMNPEEKDKVMEDFLKNEIQILISTTVIEVGIDVPNATMMVIFDSYRFGLSQLHQLRGRVGRGDFQSYCLLLSDREEERLQIMTKTTDGFKISEEDFRLRGSGDLFGTRQSGDVRFHLADIKRDFPILLHAKEDSMEILESPEYENGKYSYLRKIIEKSMSLD